MPTDTPSCSATPRRSRGVLALLIGSLASLGVATCPAVAQIRPDQVLLVYDPRPFFLDEGIAKPTSLLVAEYYAGSAKVPGGVGGQPGVRPGVRVLNLSSAGGPTTAFPDATRGQFEANLRNPIRNWLLANDPRGDIRVILLTKGIPHRIYQASPIYAGDQPPLASNSITGGTYTSSSVDSELTLVMQDLGGDTTTAGGSKATGQISNPYWRQTRPISSWPTTNRSTPKNFVQAVTSPATTIGRFWRAPVADTTNPPLATELTPGDMYLVCRLDGKSIADVKSMIDRAQGLVVNVDTATFVLDESGSNGITDTVAGNEFDNVGFPNLTWNGDDWEQTRDLLINDSRFLPSLVRYNADSNAAGFMVGPRQNYNNQGLVVSTPLIYLTSFGANSSGPAPGEQPVPPSGTPDARTTYATSFNYAPGAMFTSLESFNGRDYTNLGQAGGYPQQQSSDFLAAGGTFAVANVWEPFADGIPDNLQLVRNFYLGGLTFAEAAYTSMPGLSWQQIVIGDPLARVTRTVEDLNADGQITIDDLYSWNAASNSRKDLNRSNTVTDVDRKIIEDAVRPTIDLDMRGGQR